MLFYIISTPALVLKKDGITPKYSPMPNSVSLHEILNQYIVHTRDIYFPKYIYYLQNDMVNYSPPNPPQLWSQIMGEMRKSRGMPTKSKYSPQNLHLGGKK